MTDLLETSEVGPAAGAPEDPRVGALLQIGPNEATRAVLVGFPCDQGVRINGGRPGAASGPSEIRRALFKLTPDARSHTAHTSILSHTADLGDLRLLGRLADDQERLAEVVAQQLELDRFVIVLGGGHETTYGHVLGHLKLDWPTSILNWDAHPDVRPLVDGLGHSGSPFRQALEHPSGLCRSYTVVGLEPWCVSTDHLSWLDQHRGRAVFRDQVDQERVLSFYTEPRAPTLVTFDLDALPGALAPGVSAPATIGLELDHWFQAARLAGATPSVRSIDVVELNPTFDQDARTARIAALTIWHCLAGISTRYSM